MLEKIVTVFYFALATLFLAFPDAMREGAREGLFVGVRVVLFSLFPLMVLSRLIIALPPLVALSEKIEGARWWKTLALSPLLIPVILSGLLSGIPSAAGVIEKMTKEGKIKKCEGEKALLLSSLPSPAFILTGAFESTLYGIIFYLFSLVLNYFVAILFKSEESAGRGRVKKVTLPEAIRSSWESALLALASIVFFTSLTVTLSSLFPLLEKPLTLIFELTRASVVFKDSLPLSTLAVAFSGLSALFQIKSAAPSLSILPYLSGRVISAFFLFIFSLSPTLSLILFFLFLKISKKPCKNKVLEL